MDLLDALADVWTDAPEWEPVWEARIEDYGWRWDEGKTLLYDGDGSRVTKEQWNAYRNSSRCRDCGTRCEMNRGGSGVAGRSFRVCDACAPLDGARIVEHRSRRCDPRPGFISHWTVAADCLDCGWQVWTERFKGEAPSMELEPTPAEVIDADIARHARPHYVGHWGDPHEIAEHDDLVRAQAKRRANYRRTNHENGSL